MRITWYLVVVLFCGSKLLGQSIDTLQAYDHMTKGDTLYKHYKNYDSSLIHFLSAAELYLAAEQTERYAYALLMSANSAHRGKKYHEAEGYYKKSLAIYESIYPTDTLVLAAPYLAFGSLYGITGNYYQGLIYTKKSLDLKRKFLGEDHIETGVNYFNTGTAYMNYGEYENAMNAYQKALPIYLKEHGESHRRLSSLYVNMGILYDKRGESEKALEYYLRATDIDLELYGESHYLLAYNYYNMAISYMNLNQRDEAELYYRKSIDQCVIHNLEQLHAHGHYGLGSVAQDKKQYQEALRLYQKAIDLLQKYFGSDFPGINHSYRAMAEIMTDLEAYSRAHEYLNKTLSLLKKNYGGHHPFIASTYHQIASTYRVQEMFKEAMEATELGFAALTKRSELQESFLVGDYLDQYVLLDLVREQASVLQAKYYQSSNDLEDLKLALTTITKAIDYIDQVRRGYLLDDSKLFLQEEAMTTYEQGISTALALYQETEDHQYLDDAFRFMEKSKATLLSETLQGNSLKSIQGVPDSVLQQEMAIKQQINFTESLVAGDNHNQDSLNNQLFTLKRSYDALAALIAREYPRYYDLKYQITVPKIKNIQSQLPLGSVILSYFLGQNHWYVFALSQNAISTAKLDTLVTNSLDLTQFRYMVSNTEVSWQDSLAYLLYQQLVELPLTDLKDSIDRIIIVPDGVIGHIPFDAFITALPNSNIGKKPFLVHHYTISYTPSITLLEMGVMHQEMNQGYAGFAPVEYPQHSDDLKVAPLLGSLEEVSTANALFKGKTYLKQEATEENLKLLGGSGILHLAMHALIDDNDPMQSRLLFSAGDPQTEDGSLYASEIYGLELHSNLAILSACNTGYGEIVRGEGIMNLSRAFQYAGSPNIVMSLWQATDMSSSRIMQDFFKNLKSGLAKDVSLQKAKIAYLNQADPYQSHPAHWATFVIIGDTSPMSFNRYSWRWIVLGGLFFAVMVWLIRKSSTKM